MTQCAPSQLPANGSATVEQRRLRILISAFAVSPVRGSEPAVGWHLPLRLSAWHDVTVLCVPGIHDEPYREEIDGYLRQHGPVPGLRFEYVPHTPFSAALQRERFNGSCFRGLYYMGYRAWQRAALRRAQELHRARPFDLVHHLNITSYREPGYLWKLGIPFLWGPTTGAANVPLSYCPILSTQDSAFQIARTLCNHWQMRTNLRCRRAARLAAQVWVVSNDDQRMVAGLWGRPCQLLREVGAAPQALARTRDYDGHRPLNIAWSGMHIGRKALPLLLHALHRLQQPQRWTLTVLGTGPQTDSWKALAATLGIDQHIRWPGRLPRQQALAEVAAADLFVHTSLQEATATVVIEALSLGAPVLCHDACGMALAVTEDCGIRVPMDGPEASIAGFALALGRLLAHPHELACLSAGALRRAGAMTWDATARQIANTYQQIAAAQAAKER